MRIPNAQTRIYIDFDAINYSIAHSASPYVVGDIMSWLDRGNNVILHEDSTYKYVLEPHNVGTELDYTRDDKHLGIWYIEDAEPQYVIAHATPEPWGEDLDDYPIHIF